VWATSACASLLLSASPFLHPVLLVSLVFLELVGPPVPVLLRPLPHVLPADIFRPIGLLLVILSFIPMYFSVCSLSFFEFAGCVSPFRSASWFFFWLWSWFWFWCPFWLRFLLVVLLLVLTLLRVFLVLLITLVRLTYCCPAPSCSACPDPSLESPSVSPSPCLSPSNSAWHPRSPSYPASVSAPFWFATSSSSSPLLELLVRVLLVFIPITVTFFSFSIFV
jgi:hypothetical protein